MYSKRCDINIYDKPSTTAQVQAVHDSRGDTPPSELYRTAGVSTWLVQIPLLTIQAFPRGCAVTEELNIRTHL